MSLYQAREVMGYRPTPNARRTGATTTVRGLVIPTVALVLNDQMEACILPADHVPVDLYYDTDQLDTNGSPLITLNVGIMTGTPGDNVNARTIGTEFFSADTTARTGGMARLARRQGVRILPAPFDRSIGITVAAAAATAVASLTSLSVNRFVWQASTQYNLNDYIVLPNGVRAKCTTAGVSTTAFPPAFNSAAYNTTVADGSTLVWTIADPSVGVILEYRPARAGY